MGGRGVSSGKRENGKGIKDKKYEIKSEISGKKDKHGEFYLSRKSESEGFKAIYDAPAGTRFTVSYTIGGESLYEVGMRGMRDKTVQLIDKNGRHKARYRLIRNVSAVKNLFGNADSITIHEGKR